MKLFSTLPLFGSLLAASTLVSDAPKGTTLRLDLPTNEKIEMITEVKMDYFTDQKMQDKMMSTNITIDNHYTVTDKSGEGVHSIEYMVDRIRLKQDMQGMSMDYDSDNSDQSNPMAAQISSQFAPLIGQAINFKVNTMGKTVEKATLPAGAQNLPGIANVSEQMFIEFPAGEIKAGDSWTENKVSDAGGKEISMDLLYNVSEITKNEVIIKLKVDPSTVSLEGEDSPDMEIKQNGTLTIDRNSGKLIKSVSSSMLEIESPQVGKIFLVNNVSTQLK